MYWLRQGESLNRENLIIRNLRTGPTNLIYLFISGTNEFESLIELIRRLSQLDKDQKLVDHHFRSWHLHLWNDHELQGSHSTSFLKRKKIIIESKKKFFLMKCYFKRDILISFNKICICLWMLNVGNFCETQNRWN